MRKTNCIGFDITFFVSKPGEGGIFMYRERFGNRETKQDTKLDEMLSHMTCDGCRNHCVLTNIRCGRGNLYIEKAKQNQEQIESRGK